MKTEPPVTVPNTAPLAMLRAKWISALADHRVLQSENTHNTLRHAERDYVFAWRRTRHRIIWGARAFPDRLAPQPI